EEHSIPVALGVFIGSWITTAIIADLIYRLRHANSFFGGFKKLSLSYYAMCVAHLGVAVTLLGIVLSSAYSQEKDLRMQVGQSVEIGVYQFTLKSLGSFQKDNFIAEQADIEVLKN